MTRQAKSRPFEVNSQYLNDHIEEMAEITISDLTSQSLLLPKGESFLDYRGFRDGYGVLYRHTNAFDELTETSLWNALMEDSRVFCVVRSMLGMTPPDWAELARADRDSDVSQNAARGYDKDCRTNPGYVRHVEESNRAKKTPRRLRDMVSVAVEHLKEGAPTREKGMVHRLDQFDTKEGLESIRHAADEHVPYAVLLYERYLGRPFSSHRDSVSELVGEQMEGAVEDQLRSAGVPYRKMKRAERIEGFEQAPDFCIPDEIEPDVIIEAKITNDDGTARDKATRIIRLAFERDKHRKQGKDYEVVACIDGRGFGVRSEDMKQMLKHLGGKVFTTASLDQLVQHTRISKHAAKQG